MPIFRAWLNTVEGLCTQWVRGRLQRGNFASMEA